MIPADKKTRLHAAQVYAFKAGDGLPFIDSSVVATEVLAESAEELIGRAELKTDPRFVDRQARVKNYAVLDQILSEIFLAADRDHWLKLLEEKDVPAGPILNLKEVFDDPQVKHLDMVVELDHPSKGKVRLVGSGIRMAETPPRLELAPPVVGEHTDRILERLGIDAEARAGLRTKGVI